MQPALRRQICFNQKNTMPLGMIGYRNPTFQCGVKKNA